MPATDTQLLNAETKLHANLHLVDFTKATPDALKTLISTAIDKLNAFLDELDSIDAGNGDALTVNNQKITSQQALSDIISFDHLGLALERSWGVLSHLNSVMSNEDIRHAHHETLPLLSAYSTRVGQHKPLFNRYQLLQDDAEFFAQLSQARKRAIELALRGFKLSGVALPLEQQTKYGEIQSKLSGLLAKFSDNILDATQAFALPLTEEQLAGITDSGLALLASAGERYKEKLTNQLAQLTDMANDSAQDKAQNTTQDEADATSSRNEEIAALQTKLDALPQYAAAEHQGKCYVATLDIPVYLAIMTHADDRDLRAAIYKAYVTRASEFDVHSNAKGESLDNADNMTQIMQLRADKAKLLGFADYSQLSLASKMADSSSQVEQFLRELADKAKPFAVQDLNQLNKKAVELAIISAGETIKPWDTGYLAEKVKQDKFSLSQEEIRPYFPLPKVIDGLFTIVNRLFNIKAVEHSSDVPLWHEDVRFYQLYDADDSLIGGFYFDLFARQGKRGGAWMSGFQSKYVLETTALLTNDSPENCNKEEHKQTGHKQKEYEQLPVCFMVGNFTPPTTNDAGAQQPSLLTHNEVTTLFHEFGHGLHHLLTKIKVGDVSGISGVEWDAVELPSQFLENWVWESEGIALISSHVDTAESLPADKLKALLDAKNFQSGMQTLRQIEFALFDLLAHSQGDALDHKGLLTQLDSVRADVAIMQTPDYNRFANGFSHIFAGGYACGYFSYKWAELLSADAFAKFEEEGIFNAATGKAFCDNILAVGGSLPAKTNFQNFRGREASVDALLRHSGFVA